MSTCEEGLYSPTPDYIPDNAVNHIFEEAFKIAESVPVESSSHPEYGLKIVQLCGMVEDANLQHELETGQAPDADHSFDDKHKVELYITNNNRHHFSLMLVSWHNLGQRMYAESLSVLPQGGGHDDLLTFERGNIGNEMTILTATEDPAMLIATYNQLAITAAEGDQ